MTLTEVFAKEHIFLDCGLEPMYGDDQCYISFPCRFATVNFQLMATNGLVELADRIRKDMGYKPMHAMDEYTEDTCDNDGWYDFYAGINDYAENRMDSCIQFVVVNADSEDNEQIYNIDLGADEQTAVFNRLDEQCREHLGKGCLELLSESRREMEEDER